MMQKKWAVRVIAIVLAVLMVATTLTVTRRICRGVLFYM